MGADVRRIAFAGRSHVALAETLLGPALATWARHWCWRGDGACQLMTVSADRPAAEMPELRAAGHSNAGALLLWASADAWRQALFGPELVHIPADDMASRISLGARAALVADLFAALGIEGRLEEAATASTAAGGHVYLEVVIHQARLWLCLDAGLLEVRQAGPAVAAMPVALQARAAALSAAQVELRVEIPLLKVEMGEFLGLKPGDIIRGEPGLGAAFSVKVGDRVLPLRAALGAQGDHKAIRLDK